MLDTRMDPGIQSDYEEDAVVVSGRSALTDLRGRRVQRTVRIGARTNDSLWEIREIG